MRRRSRSARSACRPRSCTSARSRSAAPPPAPASTPTRGSPRRCAPRLQARIGPAADRRAARPFEAQANRDALVELSGALKVIAVSLTKIAGDLALMGSGPRAGIGEILLPELQKGSSIMPGKVNPVIPEVVLQVVRAGDRQRHRRSPSAGMQGQFELNVRIPLIARNLLQSLRLLSSVSRALAEKCVDGIRVNKAGCEASAGRHAGGRHGAERRDRLRQGGGDRQEGHRVRPSACARSRWRRAWTPSSTTPRST